MTRACLVDVWDTILKPDFEDRLAALTAHAGVYPATFLAEWLTSRTDRDRGKLSVASSFTRTLRVRGIDPTPELVSDLLRMDAEHAREHVRPFDDAVPFLTELRSRGVLIALVSNCGDTTRSLLEELGVIPLADSVILSCEVGSAKPSPEIYVTALEDLGVAATDAVMIDDQPSFCVGAEAVGVRAIQIVRRDLDGQAPMPGFPVVCSLLDAQRYL